MSAAKRDFLSLLDFSPEELNALIDRAIALKAQPNPGTLNGRTGVAMFEMKSTRTRVAFEAGMAQLGGHMVMLSPTDSQLGRGEPVEDTARVLSEMVDVLVIRTGDQEQIEKLAHYASIPVINAMSNRLHPCQLLADVQTFVEHRGSIAGANVAFIGDGYNMCHSYINAARQWGFSLKLACPEGYRPDPQILASTNNVELLDSPAQAIEGVDLVVTDVWSSMGHEGEEDNRLAVFDGYQIDRKMLDLASPDALFMHCLPAHRGEEVSDDLLDDPRSVVFQEAGNRLHTQKALLEFLINGGF